MAGIIYIKIKMVLDDYSRDLVIGCKGHAKVFENHRKRVILVFIG